MTTNTIQSWRRGGFWLSLAFLTLVLAQIAVAAELAGRVVGITDGDTLTLPTGAKQQVKIRLSDIDAPDSHQPYCSRANRPSPISPLARRSG